MRKEIYTHPLIWVKDETGRRVLCPMDMLRSLHKVSSAEKAFCVDDDSRLEHPKAVPGEGKLRFTKSLSPN